MSSSSSPISSSPSEETPKEPTMRSPILRLAPQIVSRRAFQTSAVPREHFLDAKAETFLKQVVEGKKITVVDFYADWCGPCKVLTPTLKALVPPEGDIDLMTINTDEQMELAAKYKVSALPTVLVLRGGEQLDKFVGALPPAQVRSFLEQLPK